MRGHGEEIFRLILIVNTILAIGYLCWGVFAHRTNERGENMRISHVLRAVCMLICPVVVPLFLMTGTLIRWIFLKTAADLEDVIFSKERVKQLTKANEEREKNIVPIEEALAVSDQANQRTLMMNVIKGETVEKSLSSISLALDSGDSETSHYAASVLSKELNGFRLRVQKMRQELKDEEESADRTKADRLGLKLLDYMNPILKQHVFTNIEQKQFVRMMDETGEELYESADMTARQYAELACRLMESGDHERAGVWCDRAMEQYPQELCSYQCKLKLLFLTEEWGAFSELLKRLKESGVAIDSETMEMIRIFQ